MLESFSLANKNFFLLVVVIYYNLYKDCKICDFSSFCMSDLQLVSTFILDTHFHLILKIW